MLMLGLWRDVVFYNDDDGGRGEVGFFGYEWMLFGDW